jgi:ubiquitin carboxyl-terminal hydrolase 48
MRFVYDAQTYSKKKIRTPIKFPASIDMREFISKDANSGSIETNKVDEELGMVYDLTAVLMHRGTSAYSGHFIARVRCPE